MISKKTGFSIIAFSWSAAVLVAFVVMRDEAIVEPVPVDKSIAVSNKAVPEADPTPEPEPKAEEKKPNNNIKVIRLNNKIKAIRLYDLDKNGKSINDKTNTIQINSIASYSFSKKEVVLYLTNGKVHRFSHKDSQKQIDKWLNFEIINHQ